MTIQNNTINETAFYRLPKALFTDGCFRDISLSAKMLYAMLLDRLSLSVRNGWQDEDGSVFVYFKMSEAEEQLDCGHSKMIRLFAELESSSLIRRKRQGQGKPMKIYVQNLLGDAQAAEQISENDAAELSENNTFEGENEPLQTSGQLEISPPEVLFSDDRLAESDTFECENESAISEKQTSELPETSGAEVSKPATNKTEINNTEMNEINLIYPPYIPPFTPESDAMDQIDTMDTMDSYRRVIKANIDYDVLLIDHPADRELIDSYVELMAEICTSKRQTVRISREDLPVEVVRSRFLKLTGEHISYVLECMKKTTTSISNIKAYLLAALYNAPLTMEQYYASLVSKDFGEVG